MGSDAKKAFNAVGRDELLKFDPSTLTIVEDRASALADSDRLARPVPEWLVRSIMKRGNRVPIIVRTNGKDADGVPIVEVVDGRQRVRAALEANKRLAELGSPPVLLLGIRTRGDDADMMAIMILTNELRQEDTPMTRARKAARFLNLGQSFAETAELFGVKESTIKQWLKLLECHATVQAAVETGELAAATATNVLSALPREEQAAALEKMRAEGTLRGASGVAAAEKIAGKGRGKTGEAGEVSKLPSRVWMKRFSGALDTAIQAERAEFDDLDRSELKGALQVLRLALEGKKPRGGAVSKIWSELSKQFARAREPEAAAAE